MTELSPAAQAVDRAMADRIQLLGEIAPSRQIAAAALRAAAMHLPCEEYVLCNVSSYGMMIDVYDLLDLATELENHV